MAAEGSTPGQMRAMLDSMHELTGDQQNLVRDYWIARMVPEVYGDNVNDSKTGLKSEVKQLRTWVGWGGGIAIALQFIQTFGLAEALKASLRHVLGGP